MQIPDTFDNERRFIFSNWSDEDFTGQWGGVPTLIKAGAVMEFPMYLAYHFAKHFVDREMYKAHKEQFVSVDEVRKEFEEKTISEITSGTDSPALASLKEKIKEEIENEINPATLEKPKRGRPKRLTGSEITSVTSAIPVIETKEFAGIN